MSAATLYVNKARPGCYMLYDEPSQGAPRWAVGEVRWVKDPARFVGSCYRGPYAGIDPIATGTADSCLSRLMAELADRHGVLFKFENFWWTRTTSNPT